MSKILKQVSNLFSAKKETAEKEEKKVNEKNKIKGNVPEEVEVVEKSREKREKGKLFVGGLSSATTSVDLENYFSRFGHVLNAVVMRFPDTLKSRGFGFVTFADSSVTEGLLLKSHVLNGKNIEVRRFNAQMSRSSSKAVERRVFVGGLPLAVSKETVRDYMSRYGEVEDVIIPLDKNTKIPKGFAFVVFKSEEGAKQCVAEGFGDIAGRRVLMKNANPRTSSVVSGHSKAAVQSGKEEAEAEEDFTSYETLSSSSGGSTQHSVQLQYPTQSDTGEMSSMNDEDISEFKKIFQNYFQLVAKEELQKAAAERKTKEKSKPAVDEVEKMLMKFFKMEEGKKSVREYLNDDEEEKDENEDGSDDYSEEEEDEDEDDSDDYTEEEKEEDDDLSKDLYERLKNPRAERLRSNMMESLKGGELSRKNPSNPKSSARKDLEGFAGGSSSANNELMECILCRWKCDGSSEEFLAHCESLAHKIKLKERFCKGQIESEKPQNIDNAHQKKISKGEEKKSTRKRSGHLKTKQTKELEVEKIEKAKSGVENRRGKGQEIKKKKDKKDLDKKLMSKAQVNDETDVGGLKALALAQSMVSIQYFDNCLRCDMCNKVIPKAKDFGLLMKNLSQHLTSKSHLNNFLLLENSIKSVVEETSEPKPRPVAQKEEKALADQSSSHPSRPRSRGGKPSAVHENKHSAKKPAEPAQGPARDESSPKDSSVFQSKFLCLFCNFESTAKSMKSHLQSETHLNVIKNKVGNDYKVSQVKCENCNEILYGTFLETRHHAWTCSNSGA